MEEFVVGTSIDKSEMKGVPLLTSPFTCLLVGPSGSGKTVLLKTLIDKNKFSHSKLFVFYQNWQNIYRNFPHNTQFFKFWLEKSSSLHEITELEQFIKRVTKDGNLKNVTFIFDDGLSISTKTNVMDEMFTRISHHYHCNVFLLLQSLFDPKLRSISRNCNYLFLFKCVRDAAQIRHLAFQMYPEKKFAKEMIKAFRTVTKEPFSALLIDFKPETKDSFRLKTDFLNDDDSFSVLCFDDYINENVDEYKCD